MSKNKLLVSVGVLALFLALFMPVALAVSQSPAESYYLGALSEPRFLPSAINAGDTVTMNIDVKNSAVLLDMTDLNATLGLGNYFSPVSASDFVGTIKAGVTNTISLKFKVNDNTPPGFYSIVLNLDYLRDGEPINQTQTISVPVSVGQQNIVINLNPKTISPGNQTTLTYSLTNNSLTPISNVLLSWSEGTGLVLPLGSDNQKFVSRINPGDTVDINYLVAVDPNITTGIYPLDVVVNYNDSNGTKTQKSTIGIIAGGGTDFDVSSEYTSTQLSFSIANVGSNNAAAVVVKLLRQPGLTISGSDTVIIGALNKGDYSIANFTVSTASTDLNSVAGEANGFRRGSGAASNSTGTSTTNAGAQASGVTGAPSDRNFASGAAQIPSSYVVEIDYTDTTGARQIVQKNFSLNSRTASGFAGGTTATGLGAAGGSTDWTLVGIVLAIIAVVSVLVNKFKTHLAWKKLLISIVIGVVVPVVILFLAPRAFTTVILVAAFAIIVMVGFFLKGKKQLGAKLGSGK